VLLIQCAKRLPGIYVFVLIYLYFLLKHPTAMRSCFSNDISRNQNNDMAE
jgi:hypothetical protein